jgi:hypothetical protein
MAIETHLPFWTPVLSPSIPGEAEAVSNDCSWVVEKYFYWGAQAASPNGMNDREVHLISMPSQHSSLAAEVFCTILTVLSYLTIIVPIIMAIAKCILRCGNDYVVTDPQAANIAQEQVETRPLTNETESDHSQTDLPSEFQSSPEQLLQDYIRGETKYVRQGAIPFPTVVTPTAEDKLEAQKSVEKWLRIQDQYYMDMQMDIEALNNFQRWNILEYCDTFTSNQTFYSQLIRVIHYTLSHILDIADPMYLDNTVEDRNCYTCVKEKIAQGSFESFVGIFANPETNDKLCERLWHLIHNARKDAVGTLGILEYLFNHNPKVTTIGSPDGPFGEVKICHPGVGSPFLNRTS